MHLLAWSVLVLVLVRMSEQCVQIDCSSWSYKFASCPVPGADAITSVEVAKKHSQSACVYGTSFGKAKGAIWVDNGCRATFNVCFKKYDATIVTPNLYKYKKVTDVSDTTHIIFKVMACNDAHVLLYEDEDDVHNNLYEIVLGGWANTKSVIRTQRQQSPPKAEATHKPLDCNCMKTFWVRWDQGVIRVGSGKNVNAGEFMSYNDTSLSPTNVNYVAISTGWGSNGVWMFKKVAVNDENSNSGHGDIFFTPNKYVYEEVTEAPGTKNIRFEVMACNDAHILLHKVDDDVQNNLYELVIGGWGNTKSVIRKQRQQRPPMAEATHKPLDCNARKSFWVRWDQDTIRVGTGKDVNAGEFMSYKDPSPTDVNYVAISTGWGSTGVWWFKLGCINSYQPESEIIPSVYPNCTVNIGFCEPSYCVRGKQFCGQKGTKRRCVPKYKTVKHWCGPDHFVQKKVVKKCACKIIGSKPHP